MPNDTYEGDIGVKISPSADSDVDGENTLPADKEYEDDSSGLSDIADKYQWDTDTVDAGNEAPAQKAAKRVTLEADDEYDDYEVSSSNTVMLKIVMSVMLIIFIVIISALVYKISSLNGELQTTRAALDKRPTTEQLDTANAQIDSLNQTITDLQGQLSTYQAQKASQGDTIDTPEGTVYVVAKGDWLGAIAERFDTPLSDLMKWNGITDPNDIQAGEHLIVKQPDTSNSSDNSDENSDH
jgi:LysM repeat protein